MTTTTLNSTPDEKGVHGGVHGLHLLSTVATFPNDNVVTTKKLPEAVLSHTFPVHGLGKLQNNLPIIISHPAKRSVSRSSVFASRKAIKTLRPDLFLRSPNSQKLHQESIHGDNKPIHHSDVIAGVHPKQDIKNDIETNSIATTGSSGSIVADKVPATAFMANGERVMAKKCTAELNYIKHKAVPMREKWMARFIELAEFKKKYGHSKCICRIYFVLRYNVCNTH